MAGGFFILFGGFAFQGHGHGRTGIVVHAAPGDPRRADQDPAPLLGDTNVGPADTPDPLPPASVLDTPAPESAPEPAPPAAPIDPPPVPTRVPAPRPTAVPAAPAQRPSSSAALTAAEQQLYSSHNAERAKVGLPPLRADATLTEVARARARDMAANNYFSHTAPNGSTAFTLLAQYGYAYAAAGENIARNNYPDGQSVGQAMTGFMNSATHRENILESRFNAAGFGTAVAASGMRYYAVVFSN